MEVDTVKEYSVDLRQTVPEGSTVVPTDVIQTWLYCAGIFDKNYTNISQVLADSTTLSALIASNNAVDYMARSTTWASAVCADSTAMSYIGLNNYCSNSLIAVSDWINAIANSAYIESVLNVKVPTMTSNTAPSGVASAIHEYSSYLAYKAFDKNSASPNWWVDTNSVNANATSPEGWIGYKFTSAKKIYCATHAAADTVPIQEWNVKGSNDGSNWTTLGSGGVQSSGISVLPCNISVSSYQYYRLYLKQKNGSSGTAHLPNAYEVQFYGRDDV